MAAGRPGLDTGAVSAHEDRGTDMSTEPTHKQRPATGWRRVWARLRALPADDGATSDVEYILLTAMVILPMFAIPPMLISVNVFFFERFSFWVNLPFP